MKTHESLGIVRNSDNLGRIVIPKEFRDAAGMLPGMPVAIGMDEDGVVSVTAYPTVAGIIRTVERVEENIQILETMHPEKALKSHFGAVKSEIQDLSRHLARLSDAMNAQRAVARPLDGPEDKSKSKPKPKSRSKAGSEKKRHE